MSRTKYIFITLFSAFILSLFISPSMAAEELTAERTIDPLIVDPGDTFQVTVVISTVSEEIANLGLSEEIPDDWIVTPIDNGGLTYQAAGNDWLLTSGSIVPGSNKTIVYEVQVPEGISGGTYSIIGEVSGFKAGVLPVQTYESEVEGNSEVTVQGDRLFSNTDWTQFQANAYNNGVTSDRAAIQEPDEDESLVVYTYHVDDAYGIDVEPLVVGDLVYVLANDTVFAVDRVGGNIEWTNTIYTTGVTTPLSTPAYGNGNLFVVSFGKLYSFDALTGEEIWNKSISSENLELTQLNTPITYDEGYLYFGEWISDGDESRKYYCFDSSGNEIWSRASSTNRGYYYAGAAVVGNYLIYGDDALHVTSVNKYDGTTVDEVNVSELLGFGYDGEREDIRSSITYSSETSRIYSSSEAGYFFSIKLKSDGKFDTSDTIRTYIGKSTSTPTVYNGRVYVGTGTYTGNSDLYCLNASDLSVIWNYAANGGIQASPVISTAYEDIDDEIYIYFTTNSVSGRVYCLKDDPENTEPDLQWYYEPSEDMNHYTLQGVAIKDGIIYYGNDAGYLFALAEWNPWDDPYSDSGEKISSDELQAAIHCWLTEEAAPTTGSIIDGDRFQVVVKRWITKT